jgi:hypothetical protein
MELMFKGGAMKKIIIMLIFLILFFISNVTSAQEWWQKWEVYPKVPKISAKEVKERYLAGEKMVFVYGGYEVKEVVCRSLIIPYTLVPPSNDGSSVNYQIPLDYWILCY